MNRKKCLFLLLISNCIRKLASLSSKRLKNIKANDKAFKSLKNQMIERIACSLNSFTFSRETVESLYDYHVGL